MTNLKSVDGLPELDNFLCSAICRNVDHFVLKVDCRFAIFLSFVECFDQFSIILSFLGTWTHFFVDDWNLRRMDGKLGSHAHTLEVMKLLLQALLVFVLDVRSIYGDDTEGCTVQCKHTSRKVQLRVIIITVDAHICGEVVGAEGGCDDSSLAVVYVELPIIPEDFFHVDKRFGGLDLNDEFRAFLFPLELLLFCRERVVDVLEVVKVVDLWNTNAINAFGNILKSHQLFDVLAELLGNAGLIGAWCDQSVGLRTHLRQSFND